MIKKISKITLNSSKHQLFSPSLKTNKYLNQLNLNFPNTITRKIPVLNYSNSHPLPLKMMYYKLKNVVNLLVKLGSIKI